MKRSCLCLVITLICLFGLSGIAFATTWVPIGSHEGWFLDSETVVKKDNNIYFWDVTISPQNKVLRHICIEMHDPLPHRGNQIKGFLYNQNNELVNEIIRVHSFSVGPNTTGSYLLEALEVALQYAREEEISSNIPKLP